MTSEALRAGAAEVPGATVAANHPGVTGLRVPAAGLEAAVHHLVASDGGRLADLFADTDTDGGVVLRLVWALDAAQRYLIVEGGVDGTEYPQLSDIAPAAFVEECEIYEQYGVRPAGGKPLNRSTPREALFLVERVEGLSAVAHGWAFAAAVEHALGITPPEPAQRTRALALELERLYNHAAAIAALCQSTGLSVGQAGAEIALERLLRLGAAVFGHRYLFGVLDIGGVARAPDLDALRRDLPGARDELRRVTDALGRTNSFLDRLEATGIVTPDHARRLGLVGPVARGAGIDIDTRRDHPHPGAPAPPPVSLREAGDVLARYQIFVAEVETSARHALQVADGGGAAATAPVPEAAGTGLGWAESPRGEALAWVRLDDTGRIARARLRPAAVRNWRAFDDAARSQNVFTDIPIIEASFWLTVAGMAR